MKQDAMIVRKATTFSLAFASTKIIQIAIIIPPLENVINVTLGIISLMRVLALSVEETLAVLAMNIMIRCSIVHNAGMIIPFV